jgi:hypothetical protein
MLWYLIDSIDGYSIHLYQKYVVREKNTCPNPKELRHFFSRKAAEFRKLGKTEEVIEYFKAEEDYQTYLELHSKEEIY